jgi:hypothetical protein
MDLDNVGVHLQHEGSAGSGVHHRDLVSESATNMMSQEELFQNYAEMNSLYFNQTKEMFWYEYGGAKIGRLYLEGQLAEEFPKWRLIGKYKYEFPCHFSLLFVSDEVGFFILGG